MSKTFAQLCHEAHARAVAKAAPYAPSRAEQDDEYRQVVDCLLAKTRTAAMAFIRESWAGDSPEMRHAVFFYQQAWAARMLLSTKEASTAARLMREMGAHGWYGRVNMGPHRGVHFCQDGSVAVFSMSNSPDEAYPTQRAFCEAYGLEL